MAKAGARRNNQSTRHNSEEFSKRDGDFILWTRSLMAVGFLSNRFQGKMPTR